MNIQDGYMGLKKVAPKISWLMPNGGTILVVLILIATQSVWAKNEEASEPVSNSSTNTISYQGQLTNASGTPLSGDYDLTFRLYGVANGGATLWTEQWIGINNLTVTDGLFHVLLGSLTPIPQNIFTDNPTVWLGVQVGADNEMMPRIQLGSVPFAVHALTVPQASITTTELANGAVIDQKISPGTFTNISLPQENLLSNVVFLQSDVEQAAGLSGVVDLLYTDINVPVSSVLRISFSGIVWKTGADGRTALGIRIDGSPNTPGTHYAQTGTSITSDSNILVGPSLSDTVFINVDPGLHRVNLIFTSWDAGTSHIRAYDMAVEILKQP